MYSATFPKLVLGFNNNNKVPCYNRARFKKAPLYCNVLKEGLFLERVLKGHSLFCKPNFKSCKVIVLYERKCHLIACLNKLGLEISFSWSY